jgi:hypothetical protein
MMQGIFCQACIATISVSADAGEKKFLAKYFIDDRTCFLLVRF